MMRAFGLVRHLSRPLVSNLIQSGFSEVAAGNGSSPKALEDWQYCKMITNELKNNNINTALSLLFQSYFNHQVLDIQIYNQMQEKMMSAALPLSYSEIVYTVYRDHFPPHALMSNWMNKLTYSRSEEFIQKLKKDYQTLGQTYPNRSPRVKREGRKQTKSQNIEPAVANETVNPPRKGRGSKVITQNISSVQLPNIDLPKVEGEMTPQELYRSKISNEVKNALSHMSIDINSFSRIVVHDVSIEFGSNEQYDDGEDLPEDQEQFNEEDMQEMGNMGMLGLDISKINIGRIQFFNDPQNDE